MARTKYQWEKGKAVIEVGYFGKDKDVKWTVDHNVGRKTSIHHVFDTRKEAFKAVRKVRKGKGWKGYGFLG